MILSLKTTSYTAAIFIALILGFLLLLGSRQYKSHKEYTAIIEQNEKIIFLLQQGRNLKLTLRLCCS